MTHRVRFGPYEADFHTQEIWKGGTRLKLAGQPFEILEMLVSRRGELVAREDLQRRLWPEDHFGDASHGLNAAVNKLREALCDSADQPRYIETLPRRGYRFIGPVEEAISANPVEEAAVLADDFAAPLPILPMVLPESTEANSAGMSVARRRWPMLATAAVALIAGGVIGIGMNAGLPTTSELAKGKQEIREREAAELKSKQPSSHLPETTEARLLPRSLWRPERDVELKTAEFRTIISGDAGNAAPQFSPDGKRIAFMSNRSGPWQIWMSNEDGSDPVQISTTDSAGTPRWSPDGQSIAFDAPANGTTEVFVAPINRPESAHALAEGRVPSFSRDGTFIYFSSNRTGEWQVWKVPVADGSEIQVTKQGGFAALESADGNVYYSKSDGENPEIWKVPTSGGGEVAVSPFVRPRTWSSWTVTKSGILLVADLADGRSHLSFYDPVHATIHELASLETAPHWMGATTDGRKVVMNDAAERQITMLEGLR
jgi:DNA-binding winged helix-turn-helix (wHTH) protein